MRAPSGLVLTPGVVLGLSIASGMSLSTVVIPAVNCWQTAGKTGSVTLRVSPVATAMACAVPVTYSMPFVKVKV